MSVSALYRYPVKSFGGECLQRVALTPSGPVGDRNWAVIDAERRVIRSAKQWPELLEMRAGYVRDPQPDAYDTDVAPVRLHAADGTSRVTTDPDVDAWLTQQTARPCRLSARRPAHDRDHYRLPRARTTDEIAAELDLLDDEVLPDFTMSDDALVQSLQTSATPPGSYVDAYPVHLLTQRALDTFSRRSGLDVSVVRLRPNIVIDTGDAAPDDEQPEMRWIGRTIRVGDAVLTVRSPTLRCSMPARAQPLSGLDADPSMTRALVRHMGRQLGVNATVITPGTLCVGDAVVLIDER